MLIAEDWVGICGTVQVILNLPENQPHRGDVAKMLVHRRARRPGCRRSVAGLPLKRMRSESGRTLLVLDTVTGGDAERLYARQGWQRCGEIPRYALYPAGGYCSTTVFYKALG